jgi:hypothetical protein
MRIPKSTTKQVPDYVISLLHIIKLKVRHTTYTYRCVKSEWAYVTTIITELFLGYTVVSTPIKSFAQLYSYTSHSPQWTHNTLTQHQGLHGSQVNKTPHVPQVCHSP